MNKEHYERLKQGPLEWNEWRLKSNVVPDLSGMVLVSTNLDGVNFKSANLKDAEINFCNLQAANLQVASLVNAKLIHCDLGMSFIQNARLIGCILTGSDLSDCQAEGAIFAESDLTDVTMINADLSNCDFRQARLTRINLSGSNVTGTKLWEISRTDWIVNRVRCEYVFWDRNGSVRTDYKPVEFARKHAQMPTIELHYQDGISFLEWSTMPMLLERLAAEHPNTHVTLQNFEATGGGARIILAVEKHSSNEEVEKLRQSAITFQSAQLELREKEVLLANYRSQVDLLINRVVPKLIESNAPKYQIRGNVGNLIEGDNLGTATSNQGDFHIRAVRELLQEFEKDETLQLVPTIEREKVSGVLQRMTLETLKVRPDHHLLKEDLKTIRNLLEGVVASTVANAIWPSLTDHWIPTINHLIAKIL